MSFTSPNPAARLGHALCATALGIAAAACGGGAKDAPEVSPVSAAKAARSAAAPRSVMVVGCVVDRFFIPTTGTPVRALAADGRLLGNALSDEQGRFTLQVPTQSDVMLQIDRPKGESLPLRVGTLSMTQMDCLLDEQA